MNTSNNPVENPAEHPAEHPVENHLSQADVEQLSRQNQALQYRLYTQVAEYAALRAQVDYKATVEALMEAENKKKASELMLQRARNVNRPCFLLGADLEKVDKGGRPGWEASFGDIAVFGETPEIAFQNFDNQWVGKEYDG